MIILCVYHEIHEKFGWWRVFLANKAPYCAIITSKLKLCKNFVWRPIKEVPLNSGSRPVVTFWICMHPHDFWSQEVLTPCHSDAYQGFDNVLQSYALWWSLTPRLFVLIMGWAMRVSVLSWEVFLLQLQKHRLYHDHAIWAGFAILHLYVCGVVTCWCESIGCAVLHSNVCALLHDLVSQLGCAVLYSNVCGLLQTCASSMHGPVTGDSCMVLDDLWQYCVSW